MNKTKNNISIDFNTQSNLQEDNLINLMLNDTLNESPSYLESIENINYKTSSSIALKELKIYYTITLSKLNSYLKLSTESKIPIQLSLNYFPTINCYRYYFKNKNYDFPANWSIFKSFHYYNLERKKDFFLHQNDEVNSLLLQFQRDTDTLYLLDIFSFLYQKFFVALTVISEEASDLRLILWSFDELSKYLDFKNLIETNGVEHTRERGNNP